MFILSQTVGNQTKIQKKKTETGLKDMYLDHFIDRISSAYSKVNSYIHKQKVIDEMLPSIPAKPFSPVWRIQGT